MANIVKFLQGKKTYISAAALALVSILGWWFGTLNSANALAVLSAAGGLAGLGAKSERYGQLVLAALSDVRDAQAAHKAVDAKAIASEIGKILPQAVGSIIATPDPTAAPTPGPFVPAATPPGNATFFPATPPGASQSK